MVKNLLKALQLTLKQYNEADASLMGAGLAFYGIISISPLLVLVLTLLGQFMDEKFAKAQLAQALAEIMGWEAANAIGSLVAAAGEGPGAGTTVVSLMVLLWGGGRLAAQVQRSLNRVFGIGVKEMPLQERLKGEATRRVQYVGMVGFIGVLALLSVAADTVMLLLRLWVRHRLGLGAVASMLALIGDKMLGLLLVSVTVGATYKLLSNAKVRWGLTLRGALLTAVLFEVGQVGIVTYFRVFDVSSAFGAAGSLVLVMLFFYYSALIFLFGAAFTRAWGEAVGRPLVPDWYHQRMAWQPWDGGTASDQVEPMPEQSGEDLDSAEPNALQEGANEEDLEVEEADEQVDADRGDGDPDRDSGL